MSIPWIPVLYKKRKRIAEAVSFSLLVLLLRHRRSGICRRQTDAAPVMSAAMQSRVVPALLAKS